MEYVQAIHSYQLWLQPYLGHRACLAPGLSSYSIRFQFRLPINKAMKCRRAYHILFHSKLSLYWLLLQILTYVIMGAGAVATEVVYLAYKGDSAAMWSKSCGSFGGFCHKATASVVITFTVSLCYIGISLISSYRLFSKYDAPVGFYNNKGIEISAF